MGKYNPALVRLALVHVANRAVAEEVVQETWLAVLQGIARFEGRSSLKTWIFSILLNQAKNRGRREGRTVAFSDLDDFAADADEPTVSPDRFLPEDHERWPGHWAAAPARWSELPEVHLLSDEMGQQIRAAIETLPPQQREVITLHDIEGWNAPEICNTLRISETNQRVLLHRARARVRNALEVYLHDSDERRPKSSTNRSKSVGT